MSSNLIPLFWQLKCFRKSGINSNKCPEHLWRRPSSARSLPHYVIVCFRCICIWFHFFDKLNASRQPESRNRYRKMPKKSVKVPIMSRDLSPALFWYITWSLSVYFPSYHVSFVTFPSPNHFGWFFDVLSTIFLSQYSESIFMQLFRQTDAVQYKYSTST